MSAGIRTERLESLDKILVCNRCTNPLRLECFKQMDDEIFDELCHSSCIRAIKTEKDDRKILLPIFNRKLESSAMRKVVLPINIPDITNDFMIVGELSSLPLDNAKSLRVTNALYGLMSDAPPAVEHPVCEDCTDSLLDQMDSQLKTDEDEHKLYRRFLEDYGKGEEDEDIEQLEEELKKLKATEEALEAELAACEAEEKAGKELLAKVEKETESLEEHEKSLLIEYCGLKRQLLSLDDSERSVNNQMLRAQAHLDKIAKINALEATFNIWHSGHFGTINNFRLGRLPKEPVEWSEINAAWGQTALLLHCLAKQINLTFERYRLVPCGSHSYIIPLEDSKTKKLPLYCLGGGIKYVLDHKFDTAMVAFLDCLQQFKEKAEAGNNFFHLPYRMDKGKIEDKNARKWYSVKIHLNSQEQWTKALKYMLTNLKWALTWVSQMVMGREFRGEGN